MKKEVIMTVRFNPDLHRRISDLAEENTRTFKMELEHLLKKGLAVYEEEERKREGYDALESRLHEIEQELESLNLSKQEARENS